MPPSNPLPVAVLGAFGATEPLIHLSGGQGQAFRSGDIILKPTPNPEEVVWWAKAYAQIPQSGFRIARTLASKNGAIVEQGWWAQEALEGDHAKDRWAEVIDTCRAFHAGIAKVARPSFIDQKSDPWSVADRAAWQESPLVCHPRLLPSVQRLVARLRPVDLPNQIIHGDFTENVLFADGLAPAVIDMSPYWRPASFALAVIIIDALVWGKASPDLLALVEAEAEPEIDQMLLRAAIRRIMEIDGQYRQWHHDQLAHIEAYRSLIDLLE